VGACGAGSNLDCDGNSKILRKDTILSMKKTCKTYYAEQTV